jgi:hypothetical protein
METGFQGPFHPENIPAILAARDEAARSPLERAAVLCRKEVEGLLEAEPLRSTA